MMYIKYLLFYLLLKEENELIKYLLVLLSKGAWAAATFDASNRCTFIFGQKKMPMGLKKINKND